MYHHHRLLRQNGNRYKYVGYINYTQKYKDKEQIGQYTAHAIIRYKGRRTVQASKKRDSQRQMINS